MPSGRSWTDSNTHDPGVTLLELLAYGLADLAYGVSDRIRDSRCGWRCMLMVAAGAAGAVLILRRRDDSPNPRR